MITASEARKVADKYEKQEPLYVVLDVIFEQIESCANVGRYQTNICFYKQFVSRNGSSFFASDEDKEKAVKLLVENGYQVQVAGDNVLIQW